MPDFKKIILIYILFAISAAHVSAQVKEQPIPRLVKQNGRFALFVDDAPYFILGAQVNNSSGWPAMLPRVWPAMEFMHANTVEIPVYWEQFEPKQGQYDIRVVDTLLAEARAQRMRLVLLWFATWKNGNPHYMPEWMKLDTERYTRIIDEQGYQKVLNIYRRDDNWYLGAVWKTGRQSPAHGGRTGCPTRRQSVSRIGLLLPCRFPTCCTEQAAQFYSC